MAYRQIFMITSCCVLMACGGGGGAGPETRSTALSDNPASSPVSIVTQQTIQGLFSSRFVPVPGPFERADRAYISIWYLDSGQEIRQLALLRLSALRAMDAQGGLSLEVPANVSTLFFEAYDKRGASTRISGEISL